MTHPVDGHSQNFREGAIDFTAGSVGGAAQVYVSQPLDTVKVKLQTFPSLYRGMVDCLKQTYQKDGILRGLYAGTAPAVLANVAENSVLFAAYGGCQKVVSVLMKVDRPEDLTILGNAFAGCFAAFFSTFTLCPTELVKCKLQALRETVAVREGAPHFTTWSITRHIYQKYGVSGFFHGLSSTFLREMPGYFFFFGGYEATREFFTEPGQTKDEIGPIRTMVAGAVGGVALWVTVFPFDSIKSRIQINSITRSVYSVGLEIVQKEGIMVLYNGLLPTILRTIPATATLFVTYEYLKKALTTLTN